MNQDTCKDCDFVGIPTFFKGIKNGEQQFDCATTEHWSCCHPTIDGGAPIGGVTICPKTLKKENYVRTTKN